MNYTQSVGRVNGTAIEDMTTSDIKRKLIEVMSERESIHYVKGWLQESYLYPCSEEVERAVAIKQLNQYLEV